MGIIIDKVCEWEIESTKKEEIKLLLTDFDFKNIVEVKISMKILVNWENLLFNSWLVATDVAPREINFFVRFFILKQK